MTETVPRDPSLRRAWVYLPLQFFGGGALLGVTLSFTWLLNSSETYDGLLSLMGAVLFGSLTAGVAMLFALLVGLPLRLVPVLWHWWITRGWFFALVIAVIGLLGVMIAFMPPFGSDIYVPSPEPSIPAGTIREPNSWIYWSSIAVSAIGLCHLMKPHKRGLTRS